MKRKVDTEMVPLQTAWPPFMTAATAAAYLDFSHAKDPRDAFQHYARRIGLLPAAYRGVIPLWRRSDLDKAVTLIQGENPLCR